MTQEHNKAVQRTLEVGDLVTFDRVAFFHWGVYIGEGDVVHLTTPDVKRKLVASSQSNDLTNSENGNHSGCVKRERLLDVAVNSKVEKNNNKDSIKPPLPREEIKKRALESLGPRSYNMLTKNCEHFASWCRNGIEQSQQVDNAKNNGGVALITSSLVGGGVLLYKAKTDGNDSNMKTCNGVGLGLLTGIGGLSKASFIGGIMSMKTCNGVDLGLLTDIGRLFYTPLPGGINMSMKTCNPELLTDIGRLLYAPFNVGIDMRSLPGGEMMERTLSGLGHKSCSTGLDEFAALCRNGIPIEVQTVLTMAGYAVAAVGVAFVAYKLYVHREKVARGIKECCSMVAKCCSVVAKCCSVGCSVVAKCCSVCCSVVAKGCSVCCSVVAKCCSVCCSGVANCCSGVAKCCSVVTNRIRSLFGK